MLQGSSAIQNIGKSEVTSPSLRITLQENYHIENQMKSTSLAQISQSINEKKHAAIFFNNRHVVYRGEAAGSTIEHRVYSYGALGTGATNSGLFTAFDFNDPTQRSSFVVTGNTLTLFYIVGYSKIYTQHSGDGINWGGTQLAFTGNTNDPLDVVGVASDECYILRTGASYRAKIQYYNVTSGASRQIMAGAHYNEPAYADPKQLTGFRGLYRDNLLFVTRDINKSVLDDVSSEKIYTFKSDTYSYYDKRLVTEVGATGSINMSSMSLGVSYAYVWFRLNGVRRMRIGFNDIVVGNFILKFNDDLDYAVEAGISRAITDYETALFPEIIAGSTNMTGSTSFEYRYLYRTVENSQYVVPTVVRRDTEVDVSDDIITYDNQDNSRISLILGNRK